MPGFPMNLGDLTPNRTQSGVSTPIPPEYDEQGNPIQYGMGTSTPVPGTQVNPPTGPLAGQNYVNASLANTGNKQNLLQEQGDIGMKEGQDLADIENTKANEEIAHANDFNSLLGQHIKAHQEDRDRTLQAYQDYAKQAGNLQDPANAYWDDHGKTVGRVLGGLAAFASGMGAGMLGKGGNPYLDYLNKQIEHNFQAHQENIKDLYNKQVAAGKIEDNEDSWRKFQESAKTKYYELATAHFTDLLQGVKSKAQGANIANLAAQTSADLDQQNIDRRNNLAKEQAAQAAAGLAIEKSVKVREDTLAHNGGDVEGADQAAAEWVANNYPRNIVNPSSPAGSLITQIQTGAGRVFDPKTDKWRYTTTDEKGNQIFTDKPAGYTNNPVDQYGVPLRDPFTHKMYDEPTRQKMDEEAKATVVQDPNGNVRQAKSKQDADAYKIMHSATNDLESDLNRLDELATLYKTAKPGEERNKINGEFGTLANDLVVRYNAAATAAKRATGHGEAILLSDKSVPKEAVTWFGPVVDYATKRVEVNQGKSSGLRRVIENNRQANEDYLLPPTTTINKSSSTGSANPNPSDKQIEDFFKASKVK
jgi:hypothetical protein